MLQVQSHLCSFKGLMGLYEANFVLFRSLISNTVVLPADAVSSVQHGEDLYLSVVDRSKYTMTIKLTHRFNENGTIKHNPGLTLRVYFDAGQVEVLSWHGHEDFDDIGQHSFKRRPSIPAKWKVNFFLGKWLEYCVLIGHKFDPYKLMQNSQTAKKSVVSAP